jgi:hypothetical protein
VRRTVRIGCSSGFWGDSAIATPQLVEGGDLDYLVSDYLAEVTLSIMASARLRNPEAGYARDLVSSLREVLPALVRRGTKVVTNAGGLNPLACRDALLAAGRAAGVSLRVAVVTGDDLLPRREELAAAGLAWEAGSPPAALTSLNAYLGAGGIAAALRGGADVVVTGRVVDSALVLGPLLHEFGWGLDDWDRLAQGSLAGHVIECGAQCTGGNFTDWRRVEDWAHLGFPVAACAADGSFVVTKPPGTGGLVTRGTVGEQIVYEIGDPRAYLLPDVICDLTGVRLEEVGRDEVRVTGARGRPAPADYKVAVTSADGFRCAGLLAIVGRDAAEKARRVGEAALARTGELAARRGLGPWRETVVEVLGAEAAYGPHGRGGGREVVLRIGAAHPERAALELLAAELAPFFTGGPPGLTTLFGGRPEVVPVLRFSAAMIPKGAVEVRVTLGDETSPVEIPPGHAVAPPPPAAELAASALPPRPETVRLEVLAWARSGDKGNHANVGVLARRAAYLPFLRAALSPEAVARHLGHLLDPAAGRVRRWDLPGLDGMNLLLENSLGGGGMASLRSDPQGKGIAQLLLDFPVPVTAEIAAEAARSSPP